MGVSVATRKTLWGRAHNECAFPTCLQELTFDGETADTVAPGVRIIGEEAHIRAQRPGGLATMPATLMWTVTTI